MKSAGRIHVRDRTATCTNRHEIDHRNQNGVATDVGIPGVHDLNLTVGDGANVSRRSADINCNQVMTSTGQTFGLSPYDPTGRTRHQHAHRSSGTSLYRRNSAIRLDNS